MIFNVHIEEEVVRSQAPTTPDRAEMQHVSTDGKILHFGCVGFGLAAKTSSTLSISAWISALLPDCPSSLEKTNQQNESTE